MPSRAERAFANQTIAATERSRIAADQRAHGWSAQRGRYVLSQPEQRAFELQQQQPQRHFERQQDASAIAARPNYNGLQQRAAMRAQPVGGRLQYGPESGGRLEERRREAWM